MLRPPHQHYHRLHTYHLDRPDLPALDDPDLIGVWDEGETTIYFFHQPRDEAMARWARRWGAAIAYQAAVDYEDWEAGGEVRPFTAAGLSFAPVWQAGEADIVLDPSVVFGSGFHPSTRLAIEGLAMLCRQAEGGHLLDLGCGTGILGLAGLRLGAGRVTAVDANRLACQVTAANYQRNGLAHRASVQRLDLFAAYPAEPATMAAANLHQELLLHLMASPTFRRHQLYLLAGFRHSQEESLLAGLETMGPLRFLARLHEDGWCCWLLARTGAPARSRNKRTS